MVMQRCAGVELPEVMRRYVHQFASQPWDGLAPETDEDVLSSMLGTYELVNMCISIPHPLNIQTTSVAELVKGSELVKLHSTQKGIDDESDEESDEEEEEEDGEEQATPPVK